jgi:hypothetical protein
MQRLQLDDTEPSPPALSTLRQILQCYEDRLISFEDKLKETSDRLDALAKEMLNDDDSNDDSSDYNPGAINQAPDCTIQHVSRRPIEFSSACPICNEGFEAGEWLMWCSDGCGNSVHGECFEKWAESCERDRKKVTCAVCRVEWVYCDCWAAPVCAGCGERLVECERECEGDGGGD